MDRRDFIKATTGVAAAAAIPASAGPAGAATDAPQMQYRTLGRSGEKVSIVGLGGFHIGMQKDENESIRIIRSAIDGGINFLDNCWDYNGGESEVRMGKALRDGYRDKVFLMTKIDGHTAAAATKQIDESLRRLQTDHLDLLQFHEVIRDDDPDKIFAPGGSFEAAMKAKQAGKFRYIGFTGHKNPLIHKKMLETAFRHGVTFDTVQMPLNVMDAHFESFEKIVLPILVEHGIGVLGMKSMGDKIILQSKVVTPVECLRYAMSLPTSVVITGIDSMPILQQALDTARNFKPLTDAERTALLKKTAQAAAQGQFEKYKTSHQFDGTIQNPQWLG